MVRVTELAITPIGLCWGLFSAVTYALYILLPAKAIEKWGSLIVIGLGMLLGGLVFPIAIQAWKYELPLTGGNLLALFGLVFIGTVFAYTVFPQGNNHGWRCKRKSSGIGRTSGIGHFNGLNHG